jgi:hypothetical protein
MTFKKVLIEVVLGLSCAVAVLAQADKSQDQQSGVPRLVIDADTHDFGQVKSGTPLSYSFKIRNKGNADLLIKSVTPG